MFQAYVSEIPIKYAANGDVSRYRPAPAGNEILKIKAGGGRYITMYGQTLHYQIFSRSDFAHHG
jgi:hypothetical protein